MSKSVFFFILLLMCGPVAAQTVQDRVVPHWVNYEQEILERAAKLKLHEDPYWHTLLHYKWTLTGRKSLVDDPNFFLSSEGKRKPRSELEANLRALFQPPGEGQKSFSCRFTARYHWLKEKLALDEKKLPAGGCAEFTKLVKNIRPESMTLIFPTFHINNPASMFGHTFISIDTATPSKLLSYAVNYSAITGDNPGPFYAIMGVLGFYRGYFSSLPYYTKVAEYSDFDSRDIWEYPLAFTRDEVVRMMMHVVELDNIYSDYFFFDENCSYNLLFLFDAARPGLKLTDNRGLWVIPVDTMRRAQKNGLIKEVIYRPSRVTRIKHIASLLSRENRDRAIELARGGMKVGEAAPGQMPDADKVMVLDLAVEYLKYRYSKGKIEGPDYREKLMALLGARSGLGNPEGTEYRIPAPTSPLEGHRSNRVMAGAGFHDRDFYTELRYRPSYHSLIDPDEGYLRNGQIIFTDFRLRYYPEDGLVRLQGVDIVDVWSISPRDRFFKSWSWKISARVLRLEPSPGESYPVGSMNFGGGLAWELPFAGLFYIMAEPDFMAGPGLDDGFSGGAGGSVGIVSRMGYFWKAHLYARDIYYPLGHVRNSFEAVLEQRVRISADNAVTAAVSARRDFDRQWMEYTLGWNLYF